MSTIIAFKPGETDGVGRLTDLLTSDDDRVRCLGRAFASGIGPALEEWLRAEQSRGTDPVVLLEVVSTLAVQHVASIAAYVLEPAGDDHAKRLLRELVHTCEDVGEVTDVVEVATGLGPPVQQGLSDLLELLAGSRRSGASAGPDPR